MFVLKSSGVMVGGQSFWHSGVCFYWVCMKAQDCQKSIEIKQLNITAPSLFSLLKNIETWLLLNFLT